MYDFDLMLPCPVVDSSLSTLNLFTHLFVIFLCRFVFKCQGVSRLFSYHSSLWSMQCLRFVPLDADPFLFMYWLSKFGFNDNDSHAVSFYFYFFSEFWWRSSQVIIKFMPLLVLLLLFFFALLSFVCFDIKCFLVKCFTHLPLVGWIKVVQNIFWSKMFYTIWLKMISSHSTRKSFLVSTTPAFSLALFTLKDSRRTTDMFLKLELGERENVGIGDREEENVAI